MDRISYLGFSNCLRLQNGEAEVVLSTDVGPRVLRYALAGGENAFGEYPDKFTETELGAWKPYAGQRLWASPELFPATYAPDNSPVAYAPDGVRSVRLTQPRDASGLVKEMTVVLAEQGSGVEVSYAITNENLWPVTVAPWSIAVHRGGVAVLPREPHCSHDEVVAASQPLGLFYFTDLQDPRYTLGKRYILLRADEQRSSPQKIGILNRRGWCAYLGPSTLLIKRFAYVEGAEYPDFGCNSEAFAAGDYLEVELLGPLKPLEPGERTTLQEHWELTGAGPVEPTLEEAVHAALQPHLPV